MIAATFVMAQRANEASEQRSVPIGIQIPVNIYPKKVHEAKVVSPGGSLNKKRGEILLLLDV